MNKYEIMFILRPNLEEASQKELVSNFEGILSSNDAKIIETKFMGQRELAYEINKYKSGYYYLITIESANDKAINEFNRLGLINEDMIRHLITKLDK